MLRAMHRAPHVSPCGPYPWGILEVLPRGAVKALRSVRSTLGLRPVSPGAGSIAALLSSTVGVDCELVAKELRAAVSAAGEQTAQLRFVETGLAVDVVAEDALVSDLVSRLVGRPIRVPPAAGAGDDASEAEATLGGAFAALAVDLARRSGARGARGGAEPVRLRGAPLGPGFVAEQTFAVLVGGRAYSAAIRFTTPDRPQATRPATLSSVDPGLRVRLALVAGLSWVTRGELSTLRVGDIWSLGDELSQSDHRELEHPVLEGACALAPAGRTMGVAASLRGVNTLVVGGHLVPLPLDVDDGDARADADVDADEESPVAEEQPKKPGLEDTVLNAPVVVRVELGSVGMTVQEWSELRAGDVIQCGRRVGAPADLRVGGAVVARGELVSVEGELGVRIVELVSAGDVHASESDVESEDANAGEVEPSA